MSTGTVIVAIMILLVAGGFIFWQSRDNIYTNLNSDVINNETNNSVDNSTNLVSADNSADNSADVTTVESTESESLENESENTQQNSPLYTIDIRKSGYNAYNSTELKVRAGSTVTWYNRDSNKHSATSDDGIFDSGLLGRDESYTYVFTEPGNYSYHCSSHPDITGTIVVE